MKYAVISKLILRNGGEKILRVYIPLMANLVWEHLGVNYDDFSVNEKMRIKKKTDEVFLGEVDSAKIYKQIEQNGEIEREVWITK